MQTVVQYQSDDVVIDDNELDRPFHSVDIRAYQEVSQQLSKYKDVSTYSSLVFPYRFIQDLDKEDARRFHTYTFKKLANLYHEFKFLQFENNDVGIDVLTIADGPGSMSLYLLDVDQRNHVYGVTLQSPDDNSLRWFPDLLRHPRFTAIDLWNGNVVENYDTIQTELNELPKFNLVVADGGFDVSSRPEEQESLSIKLILHEICMGINNLKKRGHLVVKIFNTLQVPWPKIMYLLGKCFKRLHVVKGITGKVANQERYLICESFKYRYIENFIVALENLRFESKGKYGFDPTWSLPRTEMHTKFHEFMIRQNDTSLNLQESARVLVVKNLMDNRKGDDILRLPQLYSEQEVNSYLKGELKA